ncbi:MAG TPA: hypothetical protein DIC64_01935 [Alphaproteobacteria bacterium]|nr:hypothetical protein [Alphaproteobacteria bacterium]
MDDFAVAQGAHNEVFALVVGGRDADDMDIIVVKRCAPCGTPCSEHANLVESGETPDGLAGADGGQVAFVILPTRNVGIDTCVVEIEDVDITCLAIPSNRHDALEFDEFSAIAFKVLEAFKDFVLFHFFIF